MIRFPLILAIILFGSCLVLGSVAWVVLQKEQRLRTWERRESDLLLAQRLAQSVQKRVAQMLRVLQQLPRRTDPQASVAALQQKLPEHPLFWQAVWLDKEGEMRWPVLAWEQADDERALQAAKRLSCRSFLQYVSRLRVGQAARLAAASEMQKREPDCALGPWIQLALLRDTHMRWRSHRTWRFSSTAEDGFWLMRGRGYVMLLRSDAGGWLGFALRLQHNIRDAFAARWRRGLDAVWLGRQPRLSSRDRNVRFVPLPELLSGYALYVQPRRRDTGFSWLLGGLVGLCVLLAGWASLLILRMLRRQQQEMEKREELFASITHELKTPVAAQIALLDTLERSQLSHEQRGQYQHALRREVQRLRRLIENILALQRGELSRSVSTHVDCTALCHRLVEEFEVQAMERDIELSCEQRTPFFVFVDAGGIELVLRHLVDNAIKYSRAGGWVLLEVSADDKYVQVVVRDSGPGIPERMHDTLWEPFVRGDEREVSGSGLGLYLARRILHRHRGTLTLQKHPEQGVFVATLPRSYPR